jgi:hypothetical protein
MTGPVVFEVDHLDRENRTAWSVIIRGPAHHVSPDDHPALRRPVSSSALARWLPSAKQPLVQIMPSTITGRRVQSRR